MIYLYNFLFIIFFIPAVLLVAFRYRKRFSSEFFFKAGERLGIWKLPQNIETGKPVVWVHCASLGEAKAIEPVLKKLDGYTILITAVTLSGRQYAIDMKLSSLVFFAPFDISFLVRRVFKSIKVRVLLLVETELWPGLITEAAKHGARVILVNGRLSAHSFPMYRLFGRFWKVILGSISLICARSEDDAERFHALGVPKNRIAVTGNIKYDNDNEKKVISKQELGFSPTDILWICGSTRKGENEILLGAYIELRKLFPSLKIVIAPRHTDRAKEIAGFARKNGLKCALRSQNPNEVCDCLIVDTFGELWKFYSAGDIAFVGGSLVDNGGQNPIEPAAFSKPVLFGNHMDNFLSESRAIIQKGGGFMINNSRELVDKMKELIGDEKLRVDAGQRAYEAVQSQKGAVAKTVKLIKSVVVL